LKTKFEHGMTLEELIDWNEKRSSEKNLCNFLDNIFPDGIVGYRPCYVITHPWVILKFIINHAKWAFQRVFRGWDDRAIWSLDYYISNIIYQALEELVKAKISFPVSSFEEMNEAEIDYRLEEHKKTLTKIANGFRIYSETPSYKMTKKDWNDFEEMFDLFKEYFPDLWS